MQLKKTLQKIQLLLIGSVADFSLEARIYHSICIVAFFAMAYNVPFNYLVGLPMVALISLIALTGFVWLYYLSRFRRQFTVSVIGLGILGNVFFTAVYFLNGGINGPTLILFALFFYLQSCTAPKKQQWVWLLINIVIVGSISVIEFLYPSLVPGIYVTLLSRFTDELSAYIVVIMSMFFSLKYIRKNYDQEKKTAVDRALDIELKNIQLELVNGEKNKLFSIVAHDLRSPLASIQSYLELLTTYPLNEDERKEIELKLLALTKNTSNMMSNLLSWSKSQMEGVQVNIRPLNLFHTVREIFDVEANIANEKGIELSYEIDKGTYVYADQNMLILVMRNLISNGIKFTPRGGYIRITATVDDNCQIVVTDSGIGIAAAAQKEVFSLRAKSTFGTNNEKGVGLGLILCREFIELQHGSISFMSREGEGTSFYVNLPTMKSDTQNSYQQNELSDQLD